ncbi:hypothetical protein OQI89_07215 [Lentilactobacillus diolivorans]|uniref:hypothetical protein n=1 Tax=Lentilactobacillus diolivorans TaxID=179838 RepID=UPI0024689703|nr:hypothetical protein [Lentilactobacillus diolivorans]MDH5105638.1 hypothetical protein [Lentilactobacillus diolivorans]
MVNMTFTKTLLQFSTEMLKMILITIGFILLGIKGVSVEALIFLLIVLVTLVLQFVYFQQTLSR